MSKCEYDQVPLTKICNVNLDVTEHNIKVLNQSQQRTCQPSASSESGDEGRLQEEVTVFL